MKNKIFKNVKYINPYIVGAVVSILIVSIYSIFLCNKTLPTAEGWYSYYANCILNGEIVYSDFEYLFTPIYMYMIAGFVDLVGSDLLLLRFLGVFVFAGITLLIYLILSRVFSVGASVIGAVTGTIYLQSEVYTVFYDYVRFMDIFSYLSILFMVLCLKIWKKDEKQKNCYIYLWGFFTAIFFLIKQNMGGLFLVYSILLIVFCAIYFSWKLKKIFLNFCKYLFSFMVPIFVVGIWIFKLGIAGEMIDSVFFGAMEAKGGIIAILFQWIVNGYKNFGQALLWGVLFVFILVICEKLSKEYKEKTNNKGMIIFYSIIMSVGIMLICFVERVGSYFSDMRLLDVNVIFMVTVLLLLLLLGMALSEVLVKRKYNERMILVIGLLGAYFTLCYGAGMSGGLSVGESALGLGIVICILYDSFGFKGSVVLKSIVMLYCIYLSLGCMSFKLMNPCYWWGIDESNVYESTRETNIPILKGIKVSESTKNMYEGVVNAVVENTEEEDKIYCFPQIPLFYLMCNRPDPGVYGKVQWFDVSRDESLKKDIEVLRQNLPQAVVIYNLFDAAYQGHEDLFNGGKESGVRAMRDALYSIVNRYNYVYEGTYISENNNISVFVMREKVELDKIFLEGKGKEDSPYIIKDVEEIVNLSMLVNQGYNFADVHFKQKGNIDLSNVIWVPPGYDGKHVFNGEYDYEGNTIDNVNSVLRNSDVPFGQELFK